MSDPVDSTVRQLPHNIEAEQALLGALLINNEVYEKIVHLRPEHFFDPLHAEIFDTAQKLIQANRRVSPTILRTFFENAEPVTADMTVPQYRGRLAANATTIVHVKDYADVTRQLA